MEDGEPVTLEAALIRNLMRFLDALPYVVPYLVGSIVASNSPLMQRFGDRVAETMVVVPRRRPRPRGRGPPAAAPTARIAASGALEPPQAPPTLALTLLVIVAGTPAGSALPPSA